MLASAALMVACADLPEEEWQDPRRTGVFSPMPQPEGYSFGGPENFRPDSDRSSRNLAQRAPSIVQDLDQAWPGDQDADWRRFQLFLTENRNLDAVLQKLTPIPDQAAAAIFSALARIRTSMGDASLNPRVFADEAIRQAGFALPPETQQPLSRMAMLAPRLENENHRRIAIQTAEVTQARLTFDGALSMEIQILEQELIRLRSARIAAEAAMVRNTNPYVMRLIAQETRVDRQLRDLKTLRNSRPRP